MRKTIMILMACGALAACGSGGQKFSRGTAGVEIIPARAEAAADVRVVSKSDLERWDFSDLIVSAESLSPGKAAAALGVSGTSVTRLANGAGFVVTVPENGLFSHPESRIAPWAMPKITRLAAAMHKDPSVRLDVIAHDHYDGRNRKALAESQKRAVAVQAALLSRSVGLSRVRAIGAGDQNPVASNTDPAGREANRRIEFHFRKG